MLILNWSYNLETFQRLKKLNRISSTNYKESYVGVQEIHMEHQTLVKYLK